LFLLLMGFCPALASLRKERVPDEMRAFCRRLEGRLLPARIVAVISSFLDNIAAALIGGTMAQQVFRGKCTSATSPRIVAASNAALGQRGRRHQHPNDVDRRREPAERTRGLPWPPASRWCVPAFPAAIQQHRYSPIVKDAPAGLRIEWARVFIVALILAAAIVSNVVANLRYPSCWTPSP